MEKLPVKLNELSPIIIGLIEKIQLLNSLLVTKPQKLNCVKEMNEVVCEFRLFFEKALESVNHDEHTKIFRERIERAFTKFDWHGNVGTAASDFQKHSDNAKALISSVLKLLGMKGCGILIIETYLKLCIKIVKEMLDNENTNQTTDKSNFKLLLDGVFTTSTMLKKYWHIALLPNHKNSVSLCLSQICKGLPFLLNMIEVKNSDIKKFALKMLEQCFNKMLDNIHCDGNLQVKDCGQEFITLMDYCLNKLNGLANDTTDFSSFIQKAESTVPNLKPMIDEILCYAMSVLQVTESENDHAAITSSSLKVVRDFKDLSENLNGSPICEIKLNAQSLGESLCCMERQVNSAVLRLVLEVFTGINCPLKKIVSKCRTDIQKDNKASEDLNILISDFDSEMDKIMQIGLFAISCTSDLSRILQIQSCLASLEYLETELIPCLTALYVSCSYKNKSNFQHLIDFWLNEMTALKGLIDSILDPAGFCEIVENEITNLMTTFKNALYDDVSLIRANSIFLKIIRYSRKLIKTLRRNLEDESHIEEETENSLRNFQLAVQECEAIQKLLEKKEDVSKTIDGACKRGEFLLKELKQLSSHLFAMVTSEKTESDFEEKYFENSVGFNAEMPKKNYYKICCSMDGSTTNCGDMEILTPYINMGVKRSKKRNILYTTPSKAERYQKEDFEAIMSQARHWDKTPISRKRSRCCKPLNLNLELGNTIDLEITTILENLSELNSTFAKSVTAASGKETMAETKAEKRKDANCGTENPCTNPTYKVSGCCANLNHSESTENYEQPAYAKDDGEPSDDCEDENSLGTKLRNNFLKSLNDLSQNSSLLLSKDSVDTNSDFCISDRINDLKKVEEKINFLKQQVPCMLP